MKTTIFFVALLSTIATARKAKIYFYPTAACQGGYVTCEIEPGQCCNVIQPYSSAKLDDPPGMSTLDLFGYRGCDTYGVKDLGQNQCQEPFAVFSGKWKPIEYDNWKEKRDAELVKRDCVRPSHVTVHDEDGTAHVIAIPKRHYEEVEKALFDGDHAKIKALAKAPRRLA